MVDLFHDDPIDQPLTYPGRVPDTSGVLIDDRFLPLEVIDGKSGEDWVTELDGSPIRLAVLMERFRSEPLSGRVPVVAVGSNAAPSQMLRKFVRCSVRPVVPMTLADVHGIVPGVSAHVSVPGYVPAVPVEAPGNTSQLFVLWLDDAQVRALDATEPNYTRRILSAERFPVDLVSGVRIAPCFVYVGKHGYLVNTVGQPRPLLNQTVLISQLLDESAGLRALCGETPDDFVARAQDVAVRNAVHQLFFAEKRAQAQPGLQSLRSALSGVIRTSAERADGSVSARSLMPLPAQMEPASILGEITLQLAIALASLEE